MTTMTTTETAPRVWIGCLTCYNHGNLTGEWFDAATAGDVTTADVHGFSSATHEELWCFDHEGLPISGECSPAEAAEWGQFLDGVDDWQRDAVLAWVRSGDYIAEGHGPLPSLSDFEERYAGEWSSFEDYAYDLFEDCGYGAEMPEHLRPYFDMAAWTRDLAYDYTTERATGGGVYVFRSM